MSVINRMLRDLDKRQQNPRSKHYEPAAQAPNNKRSYLWLLAACALVVVLGLGWWFLAPAPKPAIVEPNAVNPQPIATPSDDMAHRNNNTAEQKSSDKQLLVESTSNADLEAESTPELKQNPKPELEPEPKIDTKIKPKTEVETDPEPPAKPDNEGSLQVERVQLSPEELATVNLEKARTALQRGEREKGQSLLEQALVLTPDNVPVRSELAAYWYGRGMVTRALSLLEDGLNRQPKQSSWQLLYASILQEIDRLASAYPRLQMLDRDSKAYLDLLQLRATAATELNEFDQAAADYTELAVQLQQGRWWLAAGVAHEDAGNPTAALRSYQQAAMKYDLRPDVQDYIQQRIKALGGQQ